MSIRLILLSGRPDQLLQVIQRRYPSASVTIVPRDEKAVADIRGMIRLVRETHDDAICFGCKSLSLQRFQFFLSAFLLAGHARERWLIDEQGTMIPIRFSRFLMILLPHVLWEFTASCGELVAAFVKLEFLRLAQTDRRRIRS